MQRRGLDNCSILIDRGYPAAVRLTTAARKDSRRRTEKGGSPCDTSCGASTAGRTGTSGRLLRTVPDARVAGPFTGATRSDRWLRRRGAAAGMDAGRRAANGPGQRAADLRLISAAPGAYDLRGG